jgi:hypothetical protein
LQSRLRKGLKSVLKRPSVLVPECRDRIRRAGGAATHVSLNPSKTSGSVEFSRRAGFSFTIAAYLVALSGNSAVYDHIVAELESEEQAEFSPGDKP